MREVEVLGFDLAARPGDAAGVVVLRRAAGGMTTVVEGGGDPLMFDDVLRAVETLRRSAAPAPDGHYVAFVQPRQRGAILGWMLLDAWEVNLRRRWAAEERAARGRGTP